LLEWLVIAQGTVSFTGNKKKNKTSVQQVLTAGE
jgi:hypothetical protein